MAVNDDGQQVMCTPQSDNCFLLDATVVPPVTDHMEAG